MYFLKSFCSPICTSNCHWDCCPIRLVFFYWVLAFINNVCLFLVLLRGRGFGSFLFVVFVPKRIFWSGDLTLQLTLKVTFFLENFSSNVNFKVKPEFHGWDRCSWVKVSLAWSAVISYAICLHYGHYKFYSQCSVSLSADLHSGFLWVSKASTLLITVT